jgi:endonuclease III
MKGLMTKARSDKILSLLHGYYGEISPDLKFSNIFQLTVAVVLSAQTTDRQVNGVTETLFKKYPDFNTLAQARVADIERIVKSSGFYKTKSRNIIALSQMVCSRFRGKLPDDMERLLDLPGVGRKSANVILSIGFNKPGLAVDTHVSRISKRLGYSRGKSPAEIEKDLCAIIIPAQWKKTHLLFIKHGRVICKARNPVCGLCPVSGLCTYYKLTSSSLKQNS